MLAVASPDSQVVQELHLVASHVLCEYVERALPRRWRRRGPGGSTAGRRWLGRRPDRPVRTGVEVVLDGGAGPAGRARDEEASVTGPVVVVGDTLLDRDVEGVVNRLCPDSPVPVLDETAHVDRPGGAGLAAVFAAAQGAEVALVTALADDAGGARLSALLAAAGVQVYALPLRRRHPGEDPAAGPGPGAAAARPGRRGRGARASPPRRCCG